MKPIERIVLGDHVWSYDHWQLSWFERRVIEVHRHENHGTMVTVRVNGEAIRATGGHPFWVCEGEGLAERRLLALISAYETGGRQPGRWVLAIDLRAGDQILRRDGEISTLESVEIDETEETVYNFRVSELPNYAVGTCGILVHNDNQGTPAVPNRLPLRSRINESPKLVRGAESAGRSAQDSLDRLVDQLGQGNLNPGIGTKPIGRGISEARARDGARVYFRQLQDGTIEILGKSTKADQSSVIAEVLNLFGG